MKKLLFFLLASIIFCVSCTQSSKNTLLIPEQSAVIAVFDVPSLLKKAQLENIDALKNATMLNDHPVLRELVKKPANTGIDLASDMFVFFVMDNENDYACANIALTNQKQAQEFVETKLGKSFQADGKQKFYSEEHHMWIAIKNNTMLVVSSKSRDKAESAKFVNYLTTLPKDASIAENEHFKTFLKNKNDIGIFVSSTPFVKHVKSSDNYHFSQLLTIYKKMYKDLNKEDLYNNYFITNIKFGNKEVEFNYSFVLNEQLENYLQENNFSKERTSNELLQFAHATSMVAAYYSFDVEKTLAYLQNFPEFSAINEKLSEKTGFSLDNVLPLFAGDFLVSFYDIRQEEDGYSPILVMLASITDETKVNELLQKQFADFKTNAAIPYYDLSKIGGGHLLVVVHNNIVMLTTDPAALTTLADGGFENTLTNSSFTSTDNDICWFVNLDFDTYPDQVQELLAGWEKLLNNQPFKSLVISGENSSMTAKMVITMKNDEENSLTQILQFVTSL